MSFWGTIANAVATSGPGGFRSPSVAGILLGLSGGIVVGSFINHFSGKKTPLPTIVATSALGLAVLALLAHHKPH